MVPPRPFEIRGTIVDGADAIRAGDRQDGCKIVDHDIAMDIGIDRIGIVRIVSGQDAGRRILHRSGGIGRDRPRIDGAGGQHLNDAGGWHGGERGSRNRPVERRNSRSPGFDRARAHVDVDIAGPKIARVNADAVAGRGQAQRIERRDRAGELVDRDVPNSVIVKDAVTASGIDGRAVVDHDLAEDIDRQGRGNDGAAEIGGDDTGRLSVGAGQGST